MALPIHTVLCRCVHVDLSAGLLSEPLMLLMDDSPRTPARSNEMAPSTAGFCALLIADSFQTGLFSLIGPASRLDCFQKLRKLSDNRIWLSHDVPDLAPC